MQAIDELLHNIKMAGQQQDGDYAPFVYGHIANYDPKTHRVRVLLASVRNEDDVPVLTGWMTLGGVGGNGWGMQIAPMGGATVDNPTSGELVLVQRIDRGFGVQAVACMVWNQVNVPPFPELQGGEVGIKCANGASLVLDKQSNFTISGAANVSVTGSGNLAMNVEGTANIQSTGNLTVGSSGTCTLNATGNLTLSSAAALAIEAVTSTIGAVGGTVHKLVIDTFMALYNGHDHGTPGGGTSGPPNQLMTNADLTSVLSAE